MLNIGDIILDVPKIPAILYSNVIRNGGNYNEYIIKRLLSQ